jgi:hypothetical protein
MIGSRPRVRGSWMVRQSSTVIGAGLVMLGAGLPWVRGNNDISPFHLSLKWLLTRSGTDADTVKSIGMLLLLLVGIIVFGLVTAGRGVTIVGAGGAIVVAVAFVVSLSRTSFPLMETIGFGVYVAILGGVVAISGTLMGAGPRRH